ncbi:MAG: DUF4838 domain-containing protein [Ruminococcaceae bacterium]|nr:DUF4838 domain-containing protein [Oscillospiraceae bacterium]
MKKALFIILTLSILISTVSPCFAITTYYMDKFEEAAGSVAVPVGEPDAVGWSKALHIDEKNYIPSYDRHSDNYPACDIRFAYGEKGLYFSADIEDESFIFTTGRNEFFYGIDMYKKESDFYAWNGDVFIFTIDPSCVLRNSGLTLASDYQAWLCFGMTEDEEIVVRRTRFGEADLTREIESSGRVTDNGWHLETCIPWGIIGSLVDLTSFGTASFDKEELIKNGTLSKACVIFMDRYYDNETEAPETGNRLATLEMNSLEGALCPSFAPNPVIGSYGISLYTKNLPKTVAKDPLNTDFPDIKKDAWYYNAVEYTVRKGIFKGMGSGKFEPNTTLTRAMFVSLLQRYADAEAASDYTSFNDVPKNTWYTSAINWAAENKIVKGVGASEFAPNRGLTRAEAVTVLYRYFTEYDRSEYTSAPLNGFADKTSLADWSIPAFEWATKNGVINGITENKNRYLKPHKTITRAETAQMLLNFTDCTPVYTDKSHPVAQTEYDYLSTSLADNEVLWEFGLYTDNSDHSDLKNSIPIYNGDGFEGAGDFNACFSDPELIEKVTRGILLDMEENPDKRVFFLTPYEHAYFCLCADCEAAGREEGSRGGAFIKLLRGISDEAAQRFPENKILIYISDFNLDPPDTPYPENVILCARLNNRCYSHALTDESCTLNKNIVNSLTELAEYTESFYIGEAINSGEYYLAPLFALDTLYDDFMYFHSIGMKGYFSYDDSRNNVGFNDLYTYLRLCLLADRDMTREEYSRHIRVFLAEHYAENSNEVKDYIDFMGALQNMTHFSHNGAVNVTMPELFSEYIPYFDTFTEDFSEEGLILGYRFLRQVFLEDISDPETYRQENEEFFRMINGKDFRWSHRSTIPTNVDFSRSPLYWN